MREPGACEILRRGVEKRAQVLRRLTMEIRKIRIEPANERRTTGGRRKFRPESPNLGFLEDVVSAQDFVRAFTREHDLVAAVAGDLRKQKEWSGRGAQQRRLCVPDDVGKDTTDVFRLASHLNVIEPKSANDFALVEALVETRVVERDRKRAQPRITALHEGDNHRGIQSAAQIRTHRHIGSHPQPDRFVEHVSERLGRLLAWRIAVDSRKRRPPVLRCRRCALAPPQRRAGRQCANGFECCAWRQRRPEREDVIEPARIELAGHIRIDKERLNLRRKQQSSADRGVEQRADSYTISG